MNIIGWVLLLCCDFVLSGQLAMAIGKSESRQLTKKMVYPDDELHSAETNMKANVEDLQKEGGESSESFDKQTNLEKDWNKRVEKVHPTQLRNMEEIYDFSAKGARRKQRSTEQKVQSVQAGVDIRPVSSCRQAPSKSGKYMIQIGENTTPFEVLCEQNTQFGGGWTVVQYRFNGSVDFYRNWTEYRDGFGDLDGEFWLGLEHMHEITNNRPHELLVEVKDFRGKHGYARYNEFEIGSETDQFKLTKLGRYSGTAGDSMANNKGFKFSTFDNTNDQIGGTCASSSQGAWWYYHCSFANLNGRYKETPDDQTAMVWYHLRYDNVGLSYSRMMIRDIEH